MRIIYMFILEAVRHLKGCLSQQKIWKLQEDEVDRLLVFHLTHTTNNPNCLSSSQAAIIQLCN